MCIHQYVRQRAHRRPPFCNQTQEAFELLTTEDENLEEQLTDPLYQLLVCHTIFCRQIEQVFSRPSPPIAPSHRPMRRPARDPASTRDASAEHGLSRPRFAHGATPPSGPRAFS